METCQPSIKWQAEGKSWCRPYWMSLDLCHPWLMWTFWCKLYKLISPDFHHSTQEYKYSCCGICGVFDCISTAKFLSSLFLMFSHATLKFLPFEFSFNLVTSFDRQWGGMSASHARLRRIADFQLLYSALSLAWEAPTTSSLLVWGSWGILDRAPGKAKLLSAVPPLMPKYLSKNKWLLI